MLAASALPAHSPAANTFHVSTIDELRKALVSMAPELYNRAFRMSRSSVTAQDLVQDTVERALRFESQYRPGTNVKAWVHQILFSVFITKCRRNRRERKALDVLCTDPNAWTSAPAVSEVTGLSPSTRKALDAIPSVYRDVVMMVDVEEISYKDAADKLDVPVGTVMSRLHRGRRMLADALKDGYDKAA
ncbi:MAG TPA: RNA polymerase sigma factor [Polyangium sp.]|nr:RNA polymerase sigma factor [Polyangium sp.]